MTCQRLGFATVLILSISTVDVRGDFLIYNLDGGRELQGGNKKFVVRGGKMVLQGDVKVNPGGTVSFRHPSLKQEIHFGSSMLRDGQIEIKHARTTKQEFQKQLGQAGKDPEAMMKAAVWALKKGLLRDFYVAVDRILDVDPNHQAALRIKELKKQIDHELPENPETEKELRSIIKKPGMRIVTSKHFILLTDTPTKAESGQKKNRAATRLGLLEQVYESFLLLFHAQDVQLDIPTERLKVVLFQEYDDFHEHATGGNSSTIMASASGYWEQIRNVAYFFDHGTTERFKALEKLQGELRKIQADAKKSRDPDTINLIKLQDLAVAQERENSDITVVSHECTHQMAGNTGLLPRHVAIPSWVHEGLATYFEAPGDASWAGIGAVNEERLTWYRALADNRVLSNVDFIAGDQIFDIAGGHIGIILHAYAQAWALTHFMLENHIKEFVQFYRMLGEMPPDVRLNPDLLQELFTRVFGSDHKSLNQEWRGYMRSLKTDFERLEEADAKKGK